MPLKALCEDCRNGLFCPDFPTQWLKLAKDERKTFAVVVKDSEQKDCLWHKFLVKELPNRFAKDGGNEMPEKFTIQIQSKTTHDNVPPNLIRADFEVHAFAEIELEMDHGQGEGRSKNDLLAEIRLEIRSEEGK
jgi:hypothetical protein